LGSNYQEVPVWGLIIKLGPEPVEGNNRTLASNKRQSIDIFEDGDKEVNLDDPQDSEGVMTTAK
jgi:hypothetical protein